MRLSIRYLFILLGVLFCLNGTAEVMPRDILTAEGFMNVARTIQTRSMARIVAETEVNEIHSVQKAYSEHQDSINKQVSKVDRAFDLVNALVTGGSTVFHTYTTGVKVGTRLKDYLLLLNEYKDKVILSGHIPIAADTVLYSNSKDMYASVRDKIKEIAKSYADLAQYGTSLRQIKTVDMIVSLSNIDNLYSDLIDIVNSHYMTLWTYMTIRLGFWSDAILYQPRSVVVLCDEGMSRWRHSALEAAKRCTSGSLEQYKPLGGKTSMAGYSKD